MDYGNLKVPENVTPEVQAILDSYEARNKEIERNHKKEMAKLYGGAALQIGSAFIPGTLGLKAAGGAIKALTPYVGKKIAENVATGTISGLASGAVEGLGRGLMEGENPLKTMVSDATLGTLFGGAFGLAGGKIGKKLAEKNLQNNNIAPQKYFDDYVAGLAKSDTLGKSSPFSKEFGKFRGLKGGYTPTKGEVAFDIIADENGNPLRVFHGTASEFDTFDKSKLGSLTGDKSAKEGFWFTEGKNTAQSYADYASENTELNKLLKKQQAMERQTLVNWDEYDRLTEEIENLALKADNADARIIEANLDVNNLAKYDAQGKKFMEIQDEINNFIASNPKADGFLFQNLRDAVDNSLDEAVNHYMVREPEQIKIQNIYDKDNNIIKSFNSKLYENIMPERVTKGNAKYNEELETLLNPPADITNKSQLKVTIGKAADNVKNEAQKHNINLDGYEHNIDYSGLKHIEREHNKQSEVLRGQVPITPDDYRLIPEIIYNADNVQYAGKNDLGKDCFKYTKQMPDGTVYYVEEVRTGRKTLTTNTMYKHKK